MSRGGASSSSQAGPERKCLATGEVLSKSDLIRFSTAPDGQLVPDILGKLPGRGMYVRAQRAALERAISGGLFARRARQPVRVPGDLIDVIEAQLVERTIQMIAMSRKSGRAVAGYEKVKNMLSTEQAHILIQAFDGSARGKSKLSTPHYGSYIDCLSAYELGLAFGRQTVIHAALSSGGLADRVVEEARRLNGVRQVAMTGATGKGKRAK